MKSRITIGLLTLMATVGVITAGCTPKSEQAENQETKKQVQVQTIKKQNEVVSSLTVSGTIVPKQYTMIRSLTNGTVEFVPPAGTQVTAGQSLFRIRDEAVENNYFNALQSYQQTQVLTQQRTSQAELALSSSQARFNLAKKNLETSKKNTAQSLTNVQDSAIIAYNSAHNTTQQLLNVLTVGDLINRDYIYRTLSVNNLELREKAQVEYLNALEEFNKLPTVVTIENLEAALSQMNITLVKVKLVTDSTVFLLQQSVSSNTTIENDKIVINNYQTQINGHASAVLASQNSLRNTLVNNDLAIESAQNQLDLAQIELTNAEINLANAQEGARLELTISQTQVDNAGYSYSNLSLASPFTGTILSVLTEAGQQVSPGQQIIELGDLNIVEIEVDVDTEFAKALKLGDKILINDLYEGLISAIEPAGNINSGKVKVTIQGQNTSGFLVAGEIAEVTFNLTHQENDLIVIPINAATIESAATYVFVVVDGKINKRDVTLGKVFGNKVSVTAGLAEGDLLVLRNGVFVSEGELVETKE